MGMARRFKSDNPISGFIAFDIVEAVAAEQLVRTLAADDPVEAVARGIETLAPFCGYVR